jgi:hypothetical protein
MLMYQTFNIWKKPKSATASNKGLHPRYYQYVHAAPIKSQIQASLTNVHCQTVTKQSAPTDTTTL